MKRYNKIVALIFIVFSCSASQANAESKWLDIVNDIINTPDESKTSGEPGIGEIGEAFKEALRIGSETQRKLVPTEFVFLQILEKILYVVARNFVED